MSTLSIIIPAYNEGRTIHRILDKVKAVVLNGGMQKEVVIVNDCSKDNTEEAILAYKAANPDLPIRFTRHSALNKPHSETFYSHGAEGYTDYPSLELESVVA